MPTPQPRNPAACPLLRRGALPAGGARELPRAGCSGSGWRARVRCVMLVALEFIAQSIRKHACSPNGAVRTVRHHRLRIITPWRSPSYACMPSAHIRELPFFKPAAARACFPLAGVLCMRASNPCSLMRVLPCVLQVVGLSTSVIRAQKWKLLHAAVVREGGELVSVSVCQLLSWYFILACLFPSFLTYLFCGRDDYDKHV